MVCDYCAHPHTDDSNMEGGCTCIVTLKKPGQQNLSKPDDEQLHGIFFSMLFYEMGVICSYHTDKNSFKDSY